MKLGIFTDSHYSSAELTCGVRYNSRSLAKIEKAMKYFKDRNCDLVICLGDVTDYEDTHEREVENLRKVANIISRYNDMTVYFVMGNHDGFAYTPEEFYGILGEKCIPKTIVCDGKTLLFLDTCFYNDGTRYIRGREDWTDVYFPFCDKLKSDLDKAKGEVCIFLHHNIDPNVEKQHIISNANEIRSILAQSGKCTKVFQGHYHPGMENTYDGIEYLTLPAMCEAEEAYFIFEL